jgi:Pyruvate/2-oxoacid:ferredoxin oxidoreductase delta subunit
MYEFQQGRLTSEFVNDFNEYTSSLKFGIEFLSTELPQMRTIPISKSIHPQHHASTFDEVTTLLERAQGPFAVVDCICRKKKSMEGLPCKKTERKETCLAIGSMAQTALHGGFAREIDRTEAIATIEHNQREGLVLQPSNTEVAEFICSCCGCCCGMLRVHQRLPKPLDYWASNYFAVVDAATCEGCGTCQKHCQVGAVLVPQKKQPAVVDLNRCLGCGVCVPKCPNDSIVLIKKTTAATLPSTREDLYKIIMDKKKGRLSKLKLQSKFIIDAVRTGQIHLLKP